MYKLIIAEKPSLARNILAAIDGTEKRNDGYYEIGDYLITYAFGHLFTLYDVEQYLPDYDKEKKYRWTLDNLPFYPEKFRFGLSHDEGIIKQFKIIRDLINRQDVEMVINAGDSDREGEIIVRIIVSYAMKNSKPIKRLWMPDQTKKTIGEELSRLQDDSYYDNLAFEGYARTYIDWLYGINLTRLASIKSHTLLRVGRVISPIVKAIYDKEMSIINFVKEKYYVLSSKEKTNGEVVELVSKVEFKADELDQAKTLADIYNGEKAYVTKISLENKTIPSPRLFSLSKLQGVLGKKYKMSLEHSLKIVQSLYEKGYVSYPRTPSEYLATNEKGKFKEIIASFQKLGVKINFKDNKFIFDDSKIESHSALTPTYKIPKKSDLSEEEYQVYKTIVNRFFAVFASEMCVVAKTNMEISLGKREVFRLNGETVITPGWTSFDERERKEKILPKLNQGDEVMIKFAPLEKETKPPKRYSVESFNNFLKNPFREQLEKKDNDDNPNDDEDYKAVFEGIELGTEATRSTIIDNAVKQGYISLKDNTYKLEPMGKYYVETLTALNLLLAKEKTALLGKSLKKVYRKEITIDDAVKVAEEEISSLFNQIDNNAAIGFPPKIFEVDKAHTLCKCPRCSYPIAISEKGYRCVNSACSLSLFKDNHLFASLNKKITNKIAKEIFTKGEITFDDLVSKKTGNQYKATLKADFKDKYVNFHFVFDNNETNKDQGK